MKLNVDSTTEMVKGGRYKGTGGSVETPKNESERTGGGGVGGWKRGAQFSVEDSWVRAQAKKEALVA